MYTYIYIHTYMYIYIYLCIGIPIDREREKQRYVRILSDKNIKLLKGKPLMAYSIEQALQSKYYKTSDMKVVVSTDSQKYADIAIQYGAEVPILRPEEISQDLSSDFEFMKHMVEYLRISENYNPDIILQLRPTQPMRKI